MNCGLLCDRHHPLKTDRLITVSNSQPDGSLDYTTAWGQSLHIAPRPYLDNPGRYSDGDPHRDPDRDPDGPGPPPRLRLIQHTDNAEAALSFKVTTDDSDPPF